MSVAKTFIIIFDKRIEVTSIRRELKSLNSDILSFEILHDEPFKDEFGQLGDILRVNISGKIFDFDVHYCEIDEMTTTRCIELSTFNYEIFEILTDNENLNLNKMHNIMIQGLSNISLIAFYIESETLIMPNEILSKFEKGTIAETRPYEFKEINK